VRPKGEVSELLAKLRQRCGDPFGVADDPELQSAAVQTARARYEADPTPATLKAWLDVKSEAEALAAAGKKPAKA
jgi:hypothetical protein